MKKCVCIFLITFLCIVLVGCKKEMTIKDLRDIKIKIEDSLANGGDYDNFSSCVVDEKAMKVIVELVDNSKNKQEEFKKNVYDSEYIVFKQGGPYETSSEDKISLEIKEETISKESLVVSLINNSVNDCYYGDEYQLEILNGEDFEEIEYRNNNVPSWNGSIKPLKAGSSIDLNINWQSLYGSLVNGNYQIIKNICLDKDCTEKELIYTEFTIE